MDGPLKEAPPGPDDLTLNLVGAGGKFTKAVPINDDSWHHLVTTFGGGTKKIFVDGQEGGIGQSVGVGYRFVFKNFFSVIRMPADRISQKSMMSGFTGESFQPQKSPPFTTRELVMWEPPSLPSPVPVRSREPKENPLLTTLRLMPPMG